MERTGTDREAEEGLKERTRGEKGSLKNYNQSWQGGGEAATMPGKEEMQSLCERCPSISRKGMPPKPAHHDTHAMREILVPLIRIEVGPDLPPASEGLVWPAWPGLTVLRAQSGIPQIVRDYNTV